jgi:putative oligomerization/nucleic acid binding protein/phospholipase D-like protein
MLAADYPFLDLMWTMIIFFLWILWFWLLFTVFADIFRRHDLSGWGKAGWLIFTIVLPFLGVFVYLIAQSEGMTKRNLERAQEQRQQFDQYVRETAGGSGGGGAAAEIERAKQLLDGGAINQSEFEAIKQKALAT